MASKGVSNETGLLGSRREGTLMCSGDMVLTLTSSQRLVHVEPRCINHCSKWILLSKLAQQMKKKREKNMICVASLIERCQKFLSRSLRPPAKHNSL